MAARVLVAVPATVLPNPLSFVLTLRLSLLSAVVGLPLCWTVNSTLCKKVARVCLNRGLPSVLSNVQNSLALQVWVRLELITG